MRRFILKSFLSFCLVCRAFPTYALDKPIPPVSATTDKVTEPTKNTPDNTGVTSPGRVLPGEEPKRKNYWIPALEVPSFLILLNQTDRLIYPNSVYNTGFQSTKNFVIHQPWQYDQDPFGVNQVGHPYQGATMYGFARSAGLNFWESWGYSNVGSFLWKMAGETDNPSINDQITTGNAGSLLGEELYRMASVVLEGGGAHPSAWREAAAALISPPTGLNRLIFGERFKPVEARSPAVFTRLELGAIFTPTLHDVNSLPSDAKHTNGSLDYSISYGLPGKPGYRYLRPLDYFEFEIGSVTDNSNIIDHALTRGMLLGKRYEVGDDLRGIWGLYGSYDYISPTLFRVSSTALSLGTTLQKWLSPHIALQGTGMTGLGFGAAGTTTGVGERNYHYGTTPQALLASRLIIADRLMLEATGREYYVSNVGATENATENIARLESAINLRVYKDHTVGIRYIYSRRDAEYTTQSSVHQYGETILLTYNYLFNDHFGAVGWGDYMNEAGHE